MSQNAHGIEPSTKPDIEGLEDFFSSDDKTGQELVTLEEAAKRLNLSERTIQRRLKLGRLKGHKISGPRGPEWRVDISSTVDETNEAVATTEDTTIPSPASRPSSEDRTGHTEGVTVVMERLASFYEAKIEKLETKLETVVWRNGYLEAQLSDTENQIKLLPDYQSKAARAVELEGELSRLEAKAGSADALELEVKRLEAELSSLRRGWWHRFSWWFKGRSSDE